MSIREPRKTRLAALMPVVLACLAVQSATAQLSAPPPPINSYVGDPGLSGDPASWRTPEFLRDAGMLSIGAEFAYAAGYSGTGMNVGVVDSGFFAGHMREHGSLATNYAIGDRYFGVIAQGGDTEPTSGEYNQAFNDSHGTHVSGTVGASREGVGKTSRSARSPTCTASLSTPTCTSATRTGPTACCTGSCPRTATPARRRTTPTSPTSIGRSTRR